MDEKLFLKWLKNKKEKGNLGEEATELCDLIEVHIEDGSFREIDWAGQPNAEETGEEQQDRFIDRIAEDIEALCEKANHKDYEPTLHEKQQFERIHTIVTSMNNWF